MTLLRIGVGVLFLLTVVTSKPVSLNTAADESDSVEANSSEEAAVEEVEEVEEPELPGTTATESVVTEAPNVVAQTDPPATIALPASVDSTALPAETIDPQTSTDGMQMLPEDPSQTSVGVDISQDMPETDPAHDPLAPNVDVGVEVGIATDVPQQQTNDVQHEVQHEVLPDANLYPPYGKGKPTHVSVVNAVPVHISDPGVPICFTFHTQQYVAPQYKPQHIPQYNPHYNPPRGDSY